MIRVIGGSVLVEWDRSWSRRVGASMPPPAHSGTNCSTLSPGRSASTEGIRGDRAKLRPHGRFPCHVRDAFRRRRRAAAVVRRRRRDGQVGLGAFHPLRIGTTRRCRRLVRHPLADRHDGGGRACSPRPRRPTSTTPSRAPPRRSRDGRRRRGGSAVAILDRVADLISERSVERRRAHMAWENGKNRLEATRRGRGSGRPDPLLHARDGRARRLRRADGAVQRGRGDTRRDAAVRRLGGHRPVQLPGGARRRPGGRRTRRRQHGRHQAVRDRLVVRTPRCTTRSSTAACRAASSTS